MRRKVWLTAINIGIVVAVVAAYVAMTRWEMQTEDPGRIQAGAELPQVELPSSQLEIVPAIDAQTTAAGKLRLSEFIGQPVLLNFGASWCAPCEKEKGKLEVLWRRLQDGPARMVGVRVNDTVPAVHKAEKPAKDSYVRVLDPGYRAAIALGVKTYPATLLLDPEGNVLLRVNGALETVDVDRVQAALATWAHKDRTSGGLPILSQVPGFQLTSSNGNDFTQAELADRLWVSNFIFTTCQSVCPLLSQKMQLLQSKFKDSSKLHFVSISVDPERDTPAALRQYARKFGADPDRWHFLTGEWPKIRDLLNNAFKVGAPEEPMFHTSRFFLVDGRMRVRGTYDANSQIELDHLRRDIERLLGEG